MQCATTRFQRISRGAMSIIAGSVAIGMIDNPRAAIPAALCAVLLLIGATTGWCPTNLLTFRARKRAKKPEGNEFGIPQAPERINL